MFGDPPKSRVAVRGATRRPTRDAVRGATHGAALGAVLGATHGAALVAVLAALAAAWCALPAPALAQVSPGPLASAHAQLDGATQCFQCHAKAGASGMDSRCLACHTEIAWMKAHQRGLHASVRDACAKCHPDHAGRDFKLVAWDEGSPERFDHHRTGFPLEGGHAGLACAKCHTPQFQTSPAAPLIRKRDRAHSWLGLDRACASCHADPHGGHLGAQCLTCHAMNAWKPAPRFDHATTRYPLTGKHAEVACARCHEAPGLATAHSADGRVVPVYQPLPHGECSACHQDAHAGRFGPRCASCHGTADFHTINQQGFDHDRTRYPLRGRHAVLACASCHDPKLAWGARPPFAACASCHKDAHGGLATLQGKPADCAACHTVTAFTHASYTIEQHRTSGYPLEAKHVSVACAGCHRREPSGPTASRLGTSRVVMRPPHERCASCHADAHGGQLASRSDRGACESCHTVAGYTPSRFTLADHDKLRLSLRGRHAQVACAACHGAKREGLPPPAGASTAGKAAFVFAFGERECVRCHQDPHQGRFAAGAAGAAGAARATIATKANAHACTTCHGWDTFRPSTVDLTRHAALGFTLEGAHRATPCQDCHASLKAAAPSSSLLLAAHSPRALPFTDASPRCESCHTSPHGTQFAARKDQGACASCHASERWSPAARFDHDRDTAFRLQGAHQRVACAACHKPSAAAGRPAVLYRPTPTKCESCHGNGPITPLEHGSLLERSRRADQASSLAMFTVREVLSGHPSR